MVRRKWRQILAIVSTSGLLFFFNNCSGQGFEVQPSSDISSAPAGSPSPENPGQTESPPPASEKIDVFLAQGHAGRTVMSCDDGLTWVKDRSDLPDVMCWVDPPPAGYTYMECDHQPTAGRGIDYENGYFYANFGWGYNGSLRRSQDGYNWETLRTDGWGGGVASQNGNLFLMWGKYFTSNDLGQIWSPVANSPVYSINGRDLRKAGNLLFILGGTFAVSADQGLTWNLFPNVPSYEGSMVAYGNGVYVVLGFQTGTPNTAWVSRSTDDGKTWDTQQLFSSKYYLFSGIIFNGSTFQTWASDGLVYSSPDGVTWTTTPVHSDRDPYWRARIAYNPKTGTYVAVLDAWASNYDKQRAYRSKDGVNWTTLPSSDFPGGHPITNIITGQVDASACQ